MLAGYYYGGKYPMTLRWSRQQVAQNYSGEVTLADSVGRSVDMKQHSLYVVTDSTVSWLRLTARGPNVPPSWAPEWELLSIPFATPSAVLSAFPSAVSRAYSFRKATGYAGTDTLIPGTGYWVKRRRAADPVMEASAEHTADTCELAKGWNIIGALGVPLAVADLLPDGADLLGTGVYGYSDGYFVADTLQPGKAYWVRASRDGMLTLDGTPDPGARESNLSEQAPTELSPSVLTFHDAAGRTGSVSFAPPGTGYTTIDLPPAPPAGAFDVRFSSGRSREITAPESVRELAIDLSGARYPVTLEWNAPQPARGAALVIHGVAFPMGTKGSVEIAEALSGGTLRCYLRLGAANEIPVSFTLAQNYPNPFNPRTVIGFSIPSDGRVVLEVYNTLGQRVRTLVDEVAKAGFRSVAFDGEGLSSGVYFYRLRAGADIAVRKMMLLR
jgi:hypothetical protein